MTTIKQYAAAKSDIDELVNYLWADEYENWLELGKPKRHIFMVLIALCDTYGIYYNKTEIFGGADKTRSARTSWKKPILQYKRGK